MIHLFQIPRKKARSNAEEVEHQPLVEVTFQLDETEADTIKIQEDALGQEIDSILQELESEERKYIDTLECISKVCLWTITSDECCSTDILPSKWQSEDL